MFPVATCQLLLINQLTRLFTNCSNKFRLFDSSTTPDLAQIEANWSKSTDLVKQKSHSKIVQNCHEKNCLHNKTSDISQSKNSQKSKSLSITESHNLPVKC